MTNNSPLNRTTIKIHKGVDNQVRFRVLNPDRKLVSVDHLSIRARLISTENKERVLDRFADLVPNSKGDLRLTIYEGDIQNVAAGFYTLVVTGEEALVPSVPANYITYVDNRTYTAGQIVKRGLTLYSAKVTHVSVSFDATKWTMLSTLPNIATASENVNTPFFTDNAGDIVATVEIVDSADVTPMESVVLLPENWTITTSETTGYRRYLSSAIPGARIKNHLHATHSFSVATTGFTGTLRVYATLDHIPSGSPSDYFPVDITSGTQTITFSNFTGITAHTFEANFMWLIFIYETENILDDSNGTLDKLIVR